MAPCGAGSGAAVSGRWARRDVDAGRGDRGGGIGHIGHAGPFGRIDRIGLVGLIGLIVRARRFDRAAVAALSGLAALALTLALGGCALPGAAPASTSAPGAAPPPAAEPDPPPAAGRPTPLMIERQWLQSWFKGTPVRIAQRGDGPLAVEVPVAFCFEAGAARVEPPLAALLDKVAESLRRVPQARLDTLAAPADAGASAGLALRRGDAVRRYLAARGVPGRQLGPPTAGTTPVLRLVIVSADASAR